MSVNPYKLRWLYPINATSHTGISPLTVSFDVLFIEIMADVWKWSLHGKAV